MEYRNIFRRLPALLTAAFIFSQCQQPKTGPEKEPAVIVELDSTYHAMNPMDLHFDSLEQRMIDSGLTDLIDAYRSIRAFSLPNDIPPALQFNVLPAGFQLPPVAPPNQFAIPEGVIKPVHKNDLAFMSIPELSALIHSGEISCLALTQFFLDRLRKHDATLHCIVSITEEYALEQSKMLDAELAAGNDRGILHGIPYGAKDLFSFPGYKTTWGAVPFREQELEKKAGVITKLEDAGAILVAKTTLGALAMGDVWYADTTRNPWNLEEGSSGSSAGSASATAAGLLPFAIGTETWGSIVSPSTRCGTTGLRPTYGRVTRSGAMALSWSMDKAGPICRSAGDCAIVFDAIHGADPADESLLEAGYRYSGPADPSELRIGYLQSAFESDYPEAAFDRASLDRLRKMGARLIPVKLEDELFPVSALSIILEAEAAAAFDELTRSNRDSLMVRQHRFAWPNIFRTARYITAVEYIQANRIRHELIQHIHEKLMDFDVVAAPSLEGGNQLLITNLTGHPAVVLPNGFDESGSPVSITFLGNLFDEGKLLSVAAAYQEATEFHLKRPPLYDLDE